jgi:ribosomal subunit interface protein
MHIDIQSRGFTLTPALRAHAERRLRLALGATLPGVLRVAVRLSDDNGPRGGGGMRCAVRIAVAGVPGIVVEDAESDLYVAIDRAADRAGRTLRRCLARRSEQRRFPAAMDHDDAAGFARVRARRSADDGSGRRI